MMRFVVGLPLLLLAIVLPAAGQDKKPLAFTSNLYPLAVGNRWIYQGLDPKEKVTATAERMELVKRRVVNKQGNERTELIESFVVRYVGGDKSLQEQILITEDGIYRYAAGGKEITPPLRILKLPPAKGDAWACDSVSESVPLRGAFVVDQVTVDLPGKGPTPAWLSKTRDFTVGDQKLETSYWFAEGLGIVKQHVKVGKFEMAITLEEFRPGPGAGAGAVNLPGLPPVPPPLELK